MSKIYVEFGGGGYEEVQIEEERGRRPSQDGVFVFI